jgi:hypothetical protein
MWELSLAYLAAAVLIGGVFLLARRNQKQGWHKQRRVWGQAQSTEAIASFEVGIDPAVEHFSDLARLQQSLAAESEAVQKEQSVRSR